MTISFLKAKPLSLKVRLNLIPATENINLNFSGTPMKNIKKRIIFGFLLLPIFGFSAIKNSVQIESISASEMVVTFTLQNWRCDTLNLPQGRFLQFEFENAGFNGKTGQPRLPFLTVNLGTPSQSKIHFKILKAESRLLTNVLPAPVPTLRVENGFSQEEFEVAEEFYNSKSWLPEERIEIVETGFLRNQPITRIRINPVQGNLSKKQIRIYSKIRIKIWFEGIPQQSPNIQASLIPEPDESVYRQTLLNYQQARKWRIPRPVLKKPVFNGNFPEGECLKISIKNSGIYKLSGSELTAHGINISAIDPAKMRLFNNGGEELPQALNAPRPEAFIENAILVIGGEDGRFDADDYILFFGKGTVKSKFNSRDRQFAHSLNPYSNYNVYWLAWGGPTGRRVPPAVASQNTQKTKTAFLDFRFVEEELMNVLQSGPTWFGRKLRADGEPLEYVLNLKSPLPDSPVRIRAQFALIGYGPHHCFLDLNGNRLDDFTGYGFDDDDVVYKFKNIDTETTTALTDGLNQIHVGYVSPGASGSCLVDWLEVEYSRELVLEDEPLFFNSVPDSGVVEFRLQNLQSEPVQLFNITRFDSITQIAYQQDGNLLRFVDSVRADVPRQYLAVVPSQFRTVTESEIATLVNLRSQNPGADYLIVAPSQFYEAAMTLKSLRENVDSLHVKIFNTQDIYNEFGCGIADPVALRDFIKFAFENGVPQPRYVVLLGDGHFDYKGISNSSLPNWIPPFETDEKSATASRSIDDFFVWVNGSDKLMDLSLGRLPVSNSMEARKLVEKICHYESESAPGNWRNTVTIVADDEFVRNGSLSASDLGHTQQAEEVSRLFPPGFDFKKIYQINYPAVQNASISGITKPQVNQDLVQQINQGTVILNMIGHSHERQFSHENVFSLSNEVPLLENTNKLPFLVVASCAFGRFDGPSEKFIAEEMLLKADGGVIGSFASARLSYPGPNGSLNNYLIRSLFVEPLNPMRLGDAARTAKNLYQNANTEKYHLLGDPALVLKTPRKSFKITSVEPDSLRALSRVTVTGELNPNTAVKDLEASELFLKVFDSVQNLTYSATEGSFVKYSLPGNVIFRGTAGLVDEQFQIKFIVPKDISYGGHSGRISGYIAGNQLSAVGYRNNIYLGGTDTSIRDFEGPQITIGFKNRRFQSGMWCRKIRFLWWQFVIRVVVLILPVKLGTKSRWFVTTRQHKKLI